MNAICLEMGNENQKRFLRIRPIFEWETHWIYLEIIAHEIAINLQTKM